MKVRSLPGVLLDNPSSNWYNTTMSDEEREYLNETIRNLNNQLVDALRERDEARREVCKRVESASCLSDGEPTTLASDYASWCGWDCFKEDGK